MNYIKIFQKDNDLVSDGIIGKNTLSKMKVVFKLPSDEATAHFVGQINHETANFKYDKENLNYSVKGLLSTFSKYFPNKEVAEKYARKPEKIANKVYANRMGNGSEDSGDGWKFAGKGSLQLTGRSNYTAFSHYINNSKVISDPNSLLPKHYWNVAIFFFERNNLFSLTKKVDYDSVRKLTRRINGGYNGLQHRYDMTIKYYNMLKKK
jgi:putative chitinase